MLSEFRVAWRALIRAPAFATASVLSLALGAALNGTIFSLLDAALIQDPPYDEASRVLTVQDHLRVPDAYLVSWNEYDKLKESSRSIARWGAYRAGMANRYALNLDAGGVRASGKAVTASVFAVVNVQAAIGRTLHREDESPASQPVVVLSDALSRRLFVDSADILGALVRIDGRQHAVVGVMPPGFWFPEWNGDFWTALNPVANGFPVDQRSLSIVARLKPAIEVQEAVAEIHALGAQLDQSSQAQSPRWWRIHSAAEVQVPGDWKLLVVLQIAAAAVLLLACINVSNLVVIRVTVRRRVSAIRRALGASRWRVARPFIAESILLAAGTATVGAILSIVAVRLVAGVFERPAVAAEIMRTSAHVLIFAGVSALISIILVSAGPIMRGAGTTPLLVLQEGSSGGGVSGAARRIRQGAVGVQVAFSVVLVSLTTLLVAGIRAEARWEPGYQAHGLLVTSFAQDQSSAPAVAAQSTLLSRLAAIHEVERVAISARFFPDDGRIISDEGEDGRSCYCVTVTHDFIQALRIPLRSGRPFAVADRGVPVAIVDERLAQRLWGHHDVTGRRLQLGVGGSWVTVVGVSHAIDFIRPSVEPGMAPPPALFVLRRADSLARGSVYLRTRSGTSVDAALRSVRSVMSATGMPGLAHNVDTVEDRLAAYLAPLRSYTRLIGLLAMLAIVLSVIGLNGVLGYHVATRRAEFGIRSALGATPSGLVAIVAREAAALAIGGIAAGALVGTLLARVLAFAVLGISSSIVGPMFLAIATVASAAAISAFLPAFRASRTPPAAVLRQ